MLSTYADFINHNWRYKQLENDVFFQKVFAFLSRKEIIFEMIKSIEWKKSALAGCVEQLEAVFPELMTQPYTGYFIKQAVGAMVKEVLAPFGYAPTVQRRVPPSKSKFFSSASTYRLDEETAKVKLVQQWEIVKV